MKTFKTFPKILFADILLVLSLLIMQGCTVSTSEVTLGSGDRVRNSRGHGTGTVFGVKLEVLEAGGIDLSANQFTVEGQPVGGGPTVQGDTTTEIVIGKVKLTLLRSPNGDISLSVDGKSYGQIKAGDSVVLDKARVVKVNGVARSPS